MGESQNIVSVLDYGVIPNTNDFVENGIQKAIDNCFLNGGGEVRIPSGKYFVKGIRLRSNVTLHLLEDAALIGSRNPQDYFVLKNDKIEPVDASELSENPVVHSGAAFTEYHVYGSRWHNGIIKIYKAENVKIIGEKGSQINGMNCFDEDGEEHYRGPHAISINMSKNIVLVGYTIEDSANWAQMIMNSDNIIVENVVNKAGHDGVHFTSCNDITIKNCEFYTGDDCIAGYDNNNVLIENCIMNTACSAFRFGGTNVLIQHCNIFAPAKNLFRGMLSIEEKKSGKNANDIPGPHHRYNMLSFFTYFADNSVKIRECPKNIIIRDCNICGADRFLHYNFSGNELWQSTTPLVDITFDNIIAKDILLPLDAYGDNDRRLTMTIKNSSISFRKDTEESAFIRGANFEKLTLKNITVYGLKGDCLIELWNRDNNKELSFENVVCGIKEEDYISYPEIPFKSRPI